jgi:hypothetical protein
MRTPSLLPASFGPVATVFWVVQLALIVHVLRTGRPYYWIWILFAAPLIGGLAYFFVELAPDLRGSRGALSGLKPRKWRISDCRKRLDETDNVKNRLALADELSGAGEAKEARDVAAQSLQGVFRDDARTLVDVAHFEIGVAAYTEALVLLNKADTKNDRMLAVRQELLKADCYLGLKRYAEAEAAYDAVVNRYIGEAARAGLARVYEETARKDKAVEIWKAIRSKYRTTSRAWRRSEKEWYNLAVARLKAG